MAKVNQLIMLDPNTMDVTSRSFWEMNQGLFVLGCKYVTKPPIHRSRERCTHAGRRHVICTCRLNVCMMLHLLFMHLEPMMIAFG